jgi:hypothetical protein
MRNTLIVLALGGVSVWAADRFQPLNVKTGLWENTTFITTNGQIPVSSDILAKLTPEQRARVEARMNAQSAQKTKTRTDQNCLTQEDLNQGTLFNKDNKECTQKILNSSSTTLEVQVDCRHDTMTSQMLLSLQAISPELVKGTATTKITSEGHTMTSKNDLSARWLSASCGNRK